MFAILAGSVFAMDALAMVLTGVVDKIILVLPSISFVLYVDDLAAHAREDTAEKVAAILDDCTGRVIGALEDELEMKVSRAGDGMEARAGDKTVAVGSSAAIRRKLKKSVGAKGVHIKKETLHRGTNYTAGAGGEGSKDKRK